MCLSIAIERPKDVISKGEHHGFEWMVIHNGSGYRCGYVRVPSGHPWHGKSYHDLGVEIHGGLTFAEADVPCDAPGADNDWWLGFDCAHSFDAPDPELPQSDLGFSWRPLLFGSSTIRTQKYVETECRSLCQQASHQAASPQRRDRG